MQVSLPKFSRKDMNVSIMDKEEWLKRRESYLGASEVGSIIPEAVILAWKLKGLIPDGVKLSKYGSPLQVWERKKKLNHDQEELDENYLINKGILLEDGVAKLYEWKTGNTVSRFDQVLFLRDENIDFMGANLDRVINELNIPLEIKNTDYQVFKNGIPFNYFIQCGVQQKIWGSDKTILAAELGRSLGIYEVRMSDELFELVKAEAVKFWNDYYLANVRPEPETNDSDYLKDKYNAVEPESKLILSTDESIEIDEVYEHLERIKNEIKGLEKQKQLLEAKLMDKIQTNECMESMRYIFNYKKTASRKDIDKTILETKYPEIYKECLVTKDGYRKWNIKSKG